MKNLFKKISALVLAAIMVLSMCTAVFADGPSAEITVNNLDAGATLHYVQIVQPNVATETGWEFKNNAAASFKKVVAFKNLTDQQILWKLILLKNPNAKNPTGATAATTADFQSAMANVETDLASVYVDTTNPINVTSAGIYAIKATTTDTANYVYSPMAAYVEFDAYDETTGVPADLKDVTVNAKRTTIKIEKRNGDDNGVVEIDSIVTYTVKTNVPYIADDVEKATYTITDTIEGAEYVTNAEGKVALTVKIGTGNEETKAVDVNTTTDGKKTFTLDLSTIAADRTNANKDVVITYQAKVKSETVNNQVVPNDGKHNFTPATDILYTGKVTLTKTGEGEEKLANAKFVLYRTEKVEIDNGKESVKKYALVSKDTTKTNNEYVVTGWTNNEETAKAEDNLIVTDTNGQAVVRGLDSTYADYKFKEVVAPNGYSINSDDSVVSWKASQEASAATGTASMTDTKLSALPSTGGMGTYLFTIIGVVLMTCAAGAFFVSRRKTNK